MGDEVSNNQPQAHLDILVTSMSELSIGVAAAVNNMNKTVDLLEKHIDKEQNKVPEIYKHGGTIFVVMMAIGSMYMNFNDRLLIAERDILATRTSIAKLELEVSEKREVLQSQINVLKASNKELQVELSEFKSDYNLDVTNNGSFKRSVRKDIRLLKKEK